MSDYPKNATPFEHVLEQYLNRRGILRAGAAIALSSVLPASAQSEAAREGAGPATQTNNINARKTAAAKVADALSFKELPHGLDKDFTVAEGYAYQVLLRWGDPIFADAPELDLNKQSKLSQEQQFGFNNDFIGFLPLPMGSNNSDKGLLVVNHEYTNPAMMFPGSANNAAASRTQAEVEIAAHGLSVVEIKKEKGQWHVVKNSKYNRRITPETPMTMKGAAAGSKRLHTIISKDGVHTLGTYGNCAGGVTPWGTILTAEENVDVYFQGNPMKTPEAESYQDFITVMGLKNWGSYKARWNLDQNPNELLHAGWVVEIDPYDPNSKPKKRTSLGRCKHEGCNVYIDKSQHVVAYMGDDQQFEYIYKFVSKNKYDALNRSANMDLLDEGTLYVARFNNDGSLRWLPLVFGEGPLTPKNGFSSQADVAIDARKAGKLMGATPMDRPEDVEVNPANRRVYAMLTNNSARTAAQRNKANPRAHNSHGQIIEFWPENGDHTSDSFKWDLLLLAGPPGKVPTHYNAQISNNGWLSCPDNCAFDQLGNLWIASDGAQKSGIADGLWATEVDGRQRALTKRFLRTPVGAELCGPFFTPDDENLFLAVQHPGENSRFEQPSTRWPDFDSSMPPRPAVVVVTKKGGGRIGS